MPHLAGDIILQFHLTTQLPPGLLQSQLIISVDEAVQSNNVEVVSVIFAKI
jgi:hypothetical protein